MTEDDSLEEIYALNEYILINAIYAQPTSFDVPTNGTSPCLDFHVSRRKLIFFIRIFWGFPALLEEIISQVETGYSRFPFDSQIKDVMTILKPLSSVNDIKGLALQTMFCKAVDSFLLYISYLLNLIYRNNPDMLKSNDKISFEEIIGHDSMDDLISTLIEKRVNELAFKGMFKLADELSKKINLNLFEDDDTLNHAVQIIEHRNLFVHNRGIVNKLFLSRIPQYPKEIGATIDIDVESILEDILFLSNSVTDIDERALRKYKLPVISIPPESPQDDFYKKR